jgi:hypothetical protein
MLMPLWCQKQKTDREYKIQYVYCAVYWKEGWDAP